MNHSPPRRAAAVLTGLLALTLSLSGCAGPQQTASEPNPAADTAPESAEGTVQVSVLSFNDFHGYLEAPVDTLKLNGQAKKVGGAGYLARKIEDVRAESPHTAVVVAGDLVGASPMVSSLFQDEPTVEAMNEIGLTAVGVGNHEFDEGWRELTRLAEGGCHPEKGCFGGREYGGADFPFLAANVVKPDGELLFEPYVIEEYDGVKVAYVGLALDGIPSIVIPSGIEGLTFRDEAETLNALVPKLQKKGVEAIVTLIHEGGVPQKKTTDINACPDLKGPIVKIARKTNDAVDVFATGHTHQTYICRIDGKLVTSAMSYGRLLTRIDLTLNKRTGDVRKASARNLPVLNDGEQPSPVRSIVARYAKRAEAEKQRVVGRIAETISRKPNKAGLSEFGALIADAQLEATAPEDAGGADVAFMNSGGIRTALKHTSGGEDTKAGTVRFGQLHEAQPFRNQLVTMTLTGRQLHDLLEQQWTGGKRPRILQPSKGLKYTWHRQRKDGDRVDPKQIEVQGEPLDLEADYRVTVNNYLAEGGDNFSVLTEGTHRQKGAMDVEALEAYFKRHSPVSAPKLNRIRRVE